ncbi:hypothetical protein [Sphaerisporangium siamense]|uniref:Uncharacterized protein n=1 Tax=Sphaerisporangium siamense TaxID=795645 RepID=A0A7W7D8M6_9ACTN|nr:hypothetical protein [Sphaerisporangium siamense]MBB4702267.1 hypothetical protein [Sphaerisporangium siamense]
MDVLKEHGLARSEEEVLEHLVLDMLYEYAALDPSLVPRLHELAEAVGRHGDVPRLLEHAESIIHGLDSRGVISVARSVGGWVNFGLAITPDGKREAQRVRRRRADIAARRAACRIALLRWLYGQDAKVETPSMANAEHFFLDCLSFFWGEQFQAGEVDRAAARLREDKLITGGESWGGHTPRAQITSRGIDCVEQDQGDIAAYMGRMAMSGGQHVSVGGDFHGQLGMTGQGDVTQTQDQKVDIKKIMSVLDGVRAQLPTLGLDAEDAEGLDRTIAEIEEKGNAGELTQEEKKTLLQRIGGFLGKATAFLGPALLAAVQQLAESS